MSSQNHKISATSFLWIACSAEALLAIIALLLLPADPKTATFAGYSLTRLSIIGVLFAACIFLAYLSVLSLRQPVSKGLLLSIASLEVGEGWLFFVSLLFSLVCLFLLVITPPSLRGSKIIHLTPILVWILLSSLQAAIILFIYKRNKIAQTSFALRDTLIRKESANRIGYVLLVLSLLVGLATLFFTFYHIGDEGDTYEVGWLISRGQILYKDVFAHHFPLDFMWAGLVTAIFGHSMTMIRLSLLLLRVVSLTISARISRQVLAVGITSLVWSLISPFYLGNMLLYYSFDAIFIISCVFVLIAILNNEISISIQASIFVGVMVGLAILTDPEMVIAGGVIILFMVTVGALRGASKTQKIHLVSATVISVGVVLLAELCYLLITSSFDEFIRQAILFNTQIYSRYTGQTYTILGFTNSLISGLNLANPNLWINLSPYFHWDSWQGLDGWVFTAFFFRLAVIVAWVLLLIRRKYQTTIFFFVITIVLYFRGISFFQGSPFTLLAISAAALIFIEFVTSFFTIFGKHPLGKIKVSEYFITILAGIITLMFVVQSVRMSQYWIVNRAKLSYADQFGLTISHAEYLDSFACGDPEASLLVYPFGPDLYFFSHLPPADFYIFMTPWVAEIGQNEVISTLPQKHAVLYVGKEEEIWGYQVKNYLQPLITFLDQNYIEVEPNIYISPLIQKYCRAIQLK